MQYFIAIILFWLGLFCLGIVFYEVINIEPEITTIFDRRIKRKRNRRSISPNNSN